MILFIMMTCRMVWSGPVPITNTVMAADIKTLLADQKTLVSSISRVKHASMWRFPEGPMAIGCLIALAGVAMGICLMCVCYRVHMEELTNEATTAILMSLIAEERRVSQLRVANARTDESMEMSSMFNNEASFEMPPAYDDII